MAILVVTVHFLSNQVQEVNDGSEPLAASVHVTVRVAVLSFTLPDWRLCFKSGTVDRTD